MKVVERFDSDEKKFYPYNAEELNDEDDDIQVHKATGKFVEVVDEPVRNNNMAPTRPINGSSNKLNPDSPQQKNNNGKYDEDENE